MRGKIAELERSPESGRLRYHPVFMKPVVSLFSACLLLPLAGCGGDDPPPPADVHGSYTLSETNGPSSCPLPNWTQGSSTQGIPFTINQNGSSISVDVGGAGAVFL